MEKESKIITHISYRNGDIVTLPINDISKEDFEKEIKIAKSKGHIGYFETEHTEDQKFFIKKLVYKSIVFCNMYNENMKNDIFKLRWVGQTEPVWHNI